MGASRAYAGAALGLMLLAACSKGGGAANTAQASGAPAAPASGPDVAISVNDLPHLRGGYWEVTTVSNGGAPNVRRFCSSGKPVRPPASAARGCGPFSYKRTFLGAIVIDGACTEGPIASKIHMVVSGDFGTTYVSDGQSSITMQGQPPQTFTTHSVTRYLGPCPPGATPDD